MTMPEHTLDRDQAYIDSRLRPGARKILVHKILCALCYVAALGLLGYAMVVTRDKLAMLIFAALMMGDGFMTQLNTWRTVKITDSIFAAWKRNSDDWKRLSQEQHVTLVNLGAGTRPFARNPQN